MSESNELRWGILGTGYIAAKVFSLGLKRRGNVVAVASRSLEKSTEFANTHGIPKAYGSYQELLDDPSIEAVYLALPTMLHKEFTIKAAEAKKHVLCEKPVAPTLEEVQSMIQVCADNGVIFMDGTWWQHHPRTFVLTKYLYPEDSEGTIGNVRSVISTFSFSDPNMSAENIRVQPHAEPLGVLGDIGWYAVRFSLFAYNFELPEKAVGVITGRHPVTNAATQFSGVLIYSGNRSATLDCSFNAALNQRSEISGEKGTIRIPDSFMPFGGPAEDNKFPVTHFYVAMNNAGDGKTEHWDAIEQDSPYAVQEYMIMDFNACAAGTMDWKVFSTQTEKVHACFDALWNSAQNGSVPVEVKF